MRGAEFRRAFCWQFGAIVDPGFWSATEQELDAACNGVGPEHWPRWIRALVGWFLRPLDASSAPHDWEYSLPEKSYWHFTRANYRLAINATKEALYDMRVGVIPLGIMAALLCQIFGWRAYINGKPKEKK